MARTETGRTRIPLRPRPHAHGKRESAHGKVGVNSLTPGGGWRAPSKGRAHIPLATSARAHVEARDGGVCLPHHRLVHDSEVDCDASASLIAGKQRLPPMAV